MRLSADHVSMLRTALSSLLFFVIISNGLAQDIPLETWRTHFSYRQVNHMIAISNRIYCAVNNAAFYYDLEDRSITKLTKINGLSDVDITTLKYSAQNDILVIGYRSGMIDIISQEGTITIKDLADSDQIPDKAINDIQFWEEDILLATSFGIIVISISQNEITENFRSIGKNGSDVSVGYLYVNGDSLFAVTTQGIQAGNLNTNLLDFNNWYLYPETQNQTISFFGSFNNQLFSIRNDTILLSLDGDQWQETDFVLPDPVVSIKEGDGLFIATSNTVYTFDGSLTDQDVDTRGQMINDFIFRDEFWIGTSIGLIPPFQAIDEIVPNGPYSDQASNMVYENERIHLFYGPSPENYSGGSDQTGYDFFDGLRFIHRFLRDFYNLSDVAYYGDKTYFSSIGFGIYIDEDNRILNQNTGEINDSKNASGPIITDLEVTDRLWITSYDNSVPLVSFDQDGSVNEYSESIVGTDSPLAISPTMNGMLVIKKAPFAGGGMNLFVEPNERRSLSTTDGLPSNAISSIIVDIEDVLWVGTNQGLITYPDASFLFEFVQPVQPALESTFLFEDDPILALAFDGGNRTWISTNEGIRVFNASFTEIDHFFNQDNSPLPSNLVTQMVYNDQSGEMFIQTNKGLVSFRSSSSTGQSDYNNVSIFPNPVRPGYDGLVGITGLQYNTTVKITTINGALVREIETNGGTAAWDLLDGNRQKVRAGVYIVFTATRDGEEKFVGKIAVVN